jgi:hypothetical protein
VIKFNVVATDDRNDIALLKLKTNPFTLGEEARRSSSGRPLSLGVAKLRTARPRDGTAIAISGFPLMESVLVTTAGGIASAWSVDYRDALIPDGQGGYKPADIAQKHLLSDLVGLVLAESEAPQRLVHAVRMEHDQLREGIPSPARALWISSCSRVGTALTARLYGVSRRAPRVSDARCDLG